MEKNKNQWNGILLIDKPKNWTSFDVVAVIKKRFGMKKVGHFGTLDPLATGLLVVGVGGCTKIERCLDLESKTYQVEVEIGKETDTWDTTGKILKEEKHSLSNEAIIEELSHWQICYLQTVPIYSAVKVKGKKLYEYARNHEIVELPKKMVTIDWITFLKRIDEDHFSFEVACSKGTYIRSLIHDLATSMKIPLTMSNLRRINQGRFAIKDAKAIESVDEKDLYSLDQFLSFETIDLGTLVDSQKILSGNEIKKENSSFLLFQKDQKPFVFYGPSLKHPSLLSPIFFF